jgi:phytoene dehydrogenase-like protein
MAKTYEVVIVGSGHNALIVGGYLAKAGLDVCVLEKNPFIGGGVVSPEVTLPGFKHDLCATMHGFIQPNPVIKNDELQLKAKFGLEYIYPENNASIVFPDDSYLAWNKSLDTTCESIAQFSQKDADTYRKFYEWSSKLLDMLTAGMYNPPPPYGAFVSMFDQSEDGRELLRALGMSALDIGNEFFENDCVKVALTRFTSETMMSPKTAGTGIMLFMFIPMVHRYGWAIPKGGSGELSNSLGRCIEAHGGTIMTDSLVKKIKVQGGKAVGVILESGEEVLASKAVVSSAHVHTLFSDLLAGEKAVPDDIRKKVARTQVSDFMPINAHYALNEAPKWKAGEDCGKSIIVEICPWYEDYLKAFDDYFYGYPVTNSSLCATQSQFDPTRAPDGKHTLYLYHYEPYNLKDGGPSKWDEIKEEVADGCLETVRDRTTNMGPENILKRYVMSPLDYERYNPSFVQGDFMHLGAQIYQSFGNRPIPNMNYKTPIENLYMCGPSTHPGGAVVGGGRAAVQAVMADLGIDFEKVIK